MIKTLDMGTFRRGREAKAEVAEPVPMRRASIARMFGVQKSESSRSSPAGSGRGNPEQTEALGAITVTL